MTLQKSIVLAVIAIIIVAIVSFGGYFYLTHQTTKFQNPANTQNSNQTIIPGPFPNSACPIDTYQGHVNITNIYGLSEFNTSEVNDYVIAPGKNATLTYTVYIGNDLALINQSTKYNITNWVKFYHVTTSNSVENTTFGVNTSIEPKTEVFSFNTNYTVTAKIHVTSNALKGTYWVSFSPGICFGGPTFLLTIGNKPYNGSIELNSPA